MRVFDVEINQIELGEFLELLLEKARGNAKYLIGHANIRGLNFAYEDKSFRSFYNLCNLITVDGFGVLLGAKFLGQQTNMKTRFTCPDYLNQLLQEISRQNLSIYFLAGEVEMLDKLNTKLRNSLPELNFESSHGYFDKSGEESGLVIKRINEFQPDVLYVGFGMPYQENWIYENYEKFGNYVILPLGACLDFYTEHTYRGPKILTSNGFEWLVRLFTEPKRLWKRYLIGNPLFFLRIIKTKFQS